MHYTPTELKNHLWAEMTKLHKLAADHRFEHVASAMETGLDWLDQDHEDAEEAARASDRELMYASRRGE